MRCSTEKEALLPVEELRRLLDYCPVSGDLTWRCRPGVTRSERIFNTLFAGTTAGCVARDADGREYRVVTVTTPGGKFLFKAHRIAWALWHGEWPHGIVDHHNRDALNNACHNLRAADPVRNGCNRGRCRTKKGSSFKGVYLEKEKMLFSARIQFCGVSKRLGYYRDEAAAAVAYDAAAISLHGAFARTNRSLELFEDA